ncbi:hypothetical protein K474DRAFT_1654788 [Panus rudis PR-1116 ss-1]|nr:hypothetical protein K474DRAFT_1654788 [Panus rudis PR-1116 ss-1]
MEVGSGLQSCTSVVSYSQEFMLDGRRIVLIDTPGFDDTTVSDTDILKRIASSLQTSYEQGFKLSGILYLYRISDVRMGGTSRRNLNMFRKLCGDETLKNVLLVTTMWAHVEPAKGEERELELASNMLLFKPVLDNGAQMVRHYNTLESANDILRAILRNHPRPLRIQKELVEEGKGIEETAAGEAVNEELARVIRKHKEEMDQIRVEMQEALDAKDMQTKAELEAYRKQLEEATAKAERDRECLASEYAEARRQAENDMNIIKQSLEAERMARESGQQRLDELQGEFRKMSAERRAEMQQEINNLKKELNSRPRGGGGCVLQ